jgi:signal transduction histidine kinase
LRPLAEGGPEEIRTAARALNRIRDRIKTLVDDRVRMLAAVGHDLRTPITRLRLRSEFINNMSLRGQMLDDLTQMSDMIESVLVFLREGLGGRCLDGRRGDQLEDDLRSVRRYRPPGEL